MRYSDLRHEIDQGTAVPAIPAWAGSVLQAVAAGALRIPAVRHPLGFFCLPVERDGDLGVCLHVWSPQLTTSGSSTSLVHCHSWDLLSFVLYGRISNVLGRISDGTVHRLFEVTGGDDEDTIRATDRVVDYRPERLERFGAGESYSLASGVFHSTVIEGSGEAATVALGRMVRPGSDLSLGPLDAPSHTQRRHVCGDAESARAAAVATAGLAAQYTY
ncbi:hypothetical protein [Herbidospora yilanensis]|uniref:hypothetical protein n=1 Tax=Herbidospora yilanensis TaxID=354426 RepID=UPI000781217D|nr:hypothetical protein [Herbidospora yilanensis]